METEAEIGDPRVPLRGHRLTGTERTPSGVISSCRGGGQALISVRDRPEKAKRDHRPSKQLGSGTHGGKSPSLLPSPRNP